jgi:hypothetical protein
MTRAGSKPTTMASANHVRIKGSVIAAMRACALSEFAPSGIEDAVLRQLQNQVAQASSASSAKNFYAEP